MKLKKACKVLCDLQMEALEKDKVHIIIIIGIKQYHHPFYATHGSVQSGFLGDVCPGLGHVVAKAQSAECQVKLNSAECILRRETQLLPDDPWAVGSPARVNLEPSPGTCNPREEQKGERGKSGKEWPTARLLERLRPFPLLTVTTRDMDPSCKPLPSKPELTVSTGIAVTSVSGRVVIGFGARILFTTLE